MPKTTSLLSAVLLGSLLAGAPAIAAVVEVKPAAKDVVPSKLSNADEEFIDKAGHAGAAEIAAAKLALQISKDADVRAFANRMLKDHTAADAKLNTIAALKNKTPPRDPDDAQQAELQKLGGLTGSAFDKSYIEGQVKAHDEAVALFTKQGAEGKDGNVKNFANQTLPTLKQHQSHIKQLAKSHQ
ncbi:hypothetical protein IGB42_01995 [Andreprevotia sp. IGB-42]|uniref:DUF4142 domain-containing protein n=1 Tax=Andreprevotia sp. IGB-42 TaxID=2497473 RepID=UPI00135A4F21|nr:DUF4142 domain-containing protein [Andreprevotia sp. IGB-42]KAF0813644.1 hypothetical protein IGB42_01995 [Andreprevotia sp. IGB-42]